MSTRVEKSSTHITMLCRLPYASEYTYGMFRADRMKALREEKGWTQTDLAENAGISQSAVSRMERGEFKAKWSDHIGDVARVLECTIAYLKGVSDVRTGDAGEQADLSWPPVMSSRPNWDEVVISAKLLDATIPEWVFEVLGRSPTLATVDMPINPAVVLDLAKVVLRHTTPPKHS